MRVPDPAPAASRPGPRSGRFVVVEGGDGAGRSTQVRMLLPWLEQRGWAPLHVGLGRSALARRALRNHRRRPESGVRALALLYAADLADQWERRVLPALNAGFVVVGDRWTATARARCVLRGADAAWLAHILPGEPAPDLTLLLDAPPRRRLEREVAKRGLPDLVESGRDLGLDQDPSRSFLRYQALLDTRYGESAREAGRGWRRIDAAGDAWSVQTALRRALQGCLDGAGAVPEVGEDA